MRKKIYMIPFLLGFSLAAEAQTMAEFAALGDKAFADKKLEEAVGYYQKAIELDEAGNDYVTVFNLGQIYLQQNENQKAIEAFTRSALKGNTDGALLNQIKAAADAISCDSCQINAYRRIDAEAPQLKSAVNQKLFYLYKKNGRQIDAMRCCRTVLAETPDNLPMIKGMGFIFNEQKKIDSTLLYLTRAAELDPADANVNKLLGFIYYNRHQANVNAETKRYESSNKSRSSYSTMLYNRQESARHNYALAVKYLKAANEKLHDPQLTKLIDSMTQTLSVYNKK